MAEPKKKSLAAFLSRQGALFAEHSPVCFHPSFKIATYNITNLVISKQLPLIAVLLQSLDVSFSSRPDVICLQEFKTQGQGWEKNVAAGKNAPLAHDFFTGMHDIGYDHVKYDQHVILWNCSTMERVATKPGQTSPQPPNVADAHDPDYVWQKVWKGKKALDRVFEYKKEYAEATEAIHKRKPGKGEDETFFRYPPITVVLRHKATGTDYAVTTIHTPGGDDSAARRQREMEVEWLMKYERYDAVIRDMLNHGPSSKALYKAYVREEGRSEMMHIVCGDFNTNMLSMGARADANTFGLWHEFCGSAGQQSVPTSKKNFPDMVCLSKQSASRHDVKCNGMFTPSVDVPDSHHKPLIVTLTEAGRSGLPRAPMDHDDSLRQKGLAVERIMRTAYVEVVQAFKDAGDNWTEVFDVWRRFPMLDLLAAGAS